MRLMDMTGTCCGNFTGDVAPEGYWLRADDAPDHLPALDFLDRIGPARFAAVFSAMLTQPAMAFHVFRGVAAQNVYLAESFPILLQLEQVGVLPTGTAVEVWS